MIRINLSLDNHQKFCFGTCEFIFCIFHLSVLYILVFLLNEAKAWVLLLIRIRPELSQSNPQKMYSFWSVKSSSILYSVNFHIVLLYFVIFHTVLLYFVNFQLFIVYCGILPHYVHTFDDIYERTRQGKMNTLTNVFRKFSPNLILYSLESNISCK